MDSNQSKIVKEKKKGTVELKSDNLEKHSNDSKESNEKKEKKTLSIDESIEQYNNSNVGLDPVIRSPRTIYKVGDIVDVKIVSVPNYGALGETKEGFTGLIHISQIASTFVDMPDDYFYVGEHVQAKIIKFEKDNKLSLSTRFNGGKQKINPVFRELASKKEEALTEMKEEKEEIKSVGVEARVGKTTAIIKDSTVNENKQESFNNKDKENIINFIKKYTENVSPKALGDIDELFSSVGVFQTTLTLMEVVRDLDVSALITEKVREKLTGGWL